MGALGTGLALPFFSMMAQAAPLEGRSAADAFAPPSASSSALARWHDYALASITPQFSWALQPQALVAPDVLDNYSGEIARAPLFEARAKAPARLSISVATGTVSDTPAVMPPVQPQNLAVPSPGLQRTVVAPSLATTWGETGSLRLTGVLAYQRFASFGLGTTVDGWYPLPAWQRDSSYGAGARLDVGNDLGERLHWTFGYQSRVGMDAFSNYRGVFADAADFDIPASALATLSYSLTPELSIDAGMQRVQYSRIRPFTSSNLPTRFLALLGDSSSPVFAWRDLDVYSLGWTLRDPHVGSLQMRYTTRQQPVPTSRLLEDALSSATAKGMYSLAWARPFGEATSVSFSASYATSPYFLLMPTYVSRENATAGRFEFEALWSTRF
ncbi:long-chain fatty acid transport protein [Dokdonella fugitiva]|jgi:hypothetical protein|uniref:Long-chain fatty acid transport protein n=2 Tax=Dokdonella fugitiva TaxID=328517 RepID=A0A4R2IE80_9GAMM|nr:long-chain fatty acid transport protein [Dokdonella fugitiva]